MSLVMLYIYFAVNKLRQNNTPVYFILLYILYMLVVDSKAGVCMDIHGLFFTFAVKYILWVLVRTAPMCTISLCFSKDKKKKLTQNQLKIVFFTAE